MTIPSGPVKLSDIKTEFGTNMPTTANNLRAYLEYPGGIYVGATPFTSGIPTSGNVSIVQFAGKSSAYTVNTSSYTSVGSFTETIPSGTKIVTIEVWGGTGSPGSPAPTPAGSGASGSYSSSTYAISGTNWGQTFSVRIGPTAPTAGVGGGNPGFSGSASTVTNASFNVTLNMTAPGGNGGSGTSTPGAPGGTPGPIGTGGQINKQGNPGNGNPTSSPSVPPGAPGVVGQWGTGPSSLPASPGSAGITGKIIFHYS